VAVDATLLAVDAAQVRARVRAGCHAARTPLSVSATRVDERVRSHRLPCARSSAPQTRFAVADLDSGVGTLRRAALRASDVATIRVTLPPPLAPAPLPAPPADAA
jgi:hypothetical protein